MPDPFADPLVVLLMLGAAVLMILIVWPPGGDP